MSKISVIIIIYKVEKYLRQCIESVMHQTYDNLEIICVVGKGDIKCEEIADELADKDARIKVIKAEPKGTADARNRGLDAVTGDYIAFVDGDDYIEADMFETMICAAKKNQADVSVVGKYYLYTNCTDGMNENKELVLSPKEAFEIILYQEGFFLHLWDKLYKADLFKGVRFPDGKLVEDRQMAFNILSRAERIVYNSASKYYFRVSEDSGSRIENNLIMSLKADYEICEGMLKLYPEIKPAVDFFLVNENLSVIQNSFLYGVFSKSHDKEYLSYVRKNASRVYGNSRVPESLKVKIMMCSISPKLFKYVTLTRRSKFLKNHVAFNAGNDWNATFAVQGVKNEG